MKFRSSLSILICTILMSCSGNILFEDSSSEQSGEIQITLPNSKSISQNESQSLTDIYEVVAYNTSNVYSGSGTPGNILKISVPIGTYNVIVLAGKNSNLSSKAVSLLASSINEDVVVVQDQRTTVNAQMYSVTSSFIVPDQVIASRTFDVTISGKTNNSVLGFGGFFAIYYDSANDFFALPTTTELLITKTRTASATVGQIVVKIQNSVGNIALIDSKYGKNIVLKTDNGFSNNWNWMTSYCLENTSYSGEVKKTVTIIEDPTGIGVNIGW